MDANETSEEKKVVIIPSILHLDKEWVIKIFNWW